MGLVLLVEEGCRPAVEDLCSRAGIQASWSRKDGRLSLEIEGTDEEGRFLVRRLGARQIRFEVASLDGKELRTERTERW